MEAERKKEASRPYLLGQLHLDVVHLVHDQVLESCRALPVHSGGQVVVEEAPLLVPHVALRGGYASLALLKECPREHVRAPRELLLGEGRADHPEVVEDDNRLRAEKDAEHAAIALAQALQALAQIFGVQEGNVAHQGEAKGTWRAGTTVVGKHLPWAGARAEGQ